MTILFSIDRQSPVPIRDQLIANILSAIKDGDLKPGDRLVPDDIADQSSASVDTVRNALKILTANQRVTAIPGKGTFVRQTIAGHSTDPLPSFTTRTEAVGARPSSKVMAAAITAATNLLAPLLNLQVNAPVFMLERIRLIDKQPVSIQRAFVPHALLTGKDILQFDFSTDSLYRVLRDEYGFDMDSATARTWFQPRLALRDEDDPAHDEVLALGLDPEQEHAVLIQRQITFTKGEQPIEFSRTILPPTREYFFVDGILRSSEGSSLIS